MTYEYCTFIQGAILDNETMSQLPQGEFIKKYVQYSCPNITESN